MEPCGDVSTAQPWRQSLPQYCTLSVNISTERPAVPGIGKIFLVQCTWPEKAQIIDHPKHYGTSISKLWCQLTSTKWNGAVPEPCSKYTQTAVVQYCLSGVFSVARRHYRRTQPIEKKRPRRQKVELSRTYLACVRKTHCRGAEARSVPSVFSTKITTERGLEEAIGRSISSATGGK